MEPELVVEDAAGQGAQGAVRELGFSSGGRAAPEVVPDPELAEKARRRRYSAKYKLAVVRREADACSKPGEVGALLRREGLLARLWGRGARNATRARSARLSPSSVVRPRRARTLLSW